uniref:H(+)/Cl(-) exchange transporter 5 (Trinotate prediction) n=1 Tax=Myxobolus squamalis TaxID=59785 RepID=A0A6B2FVC0_MYXSQ
MSNYRLAHQMYGDCSYENSFNSGLCSNWKSNISLGDTASEFPLLAVTLFLKSIFLIISFSLKIPNGFIFPIMTIGAVFGRIVGNAMNYMLLIFPDWYFFKKYCNSQDSNSPCIDIALYAVIGSSAFLAGSTHITVTLVVIMVELIDGAGYIVPIMVSVLIAKSVSKLFTKLNIFEKSCILNDYPFIDLSASKIRDIGTAHDVIAAKKLRFLISLT